MNKIKKTQQGFSLIELLVALLIGLVLLLGVGQVFLSSRQTFTTNEAMAKLQENGRFSLEFIASSARQAGYLSSGSILDVPFPAEPVNCGLGSAPSNPCSANGAGSASDRVSFAAEPVVIDGSLRDCSGTVVAANRVIINSFFIIPADANNPHSSLGCSSYDRNQKAWITQNQRLIDGIESIQVLYGLDSRDDALSTNQFVSADRVANAAGWGNVVAVRIAVLANSLDNITPAPPQRNYYLLDAAPFIPAAGDQRSRQVFTTTIHFKNIL